MTSILSSIDPADFPTVDGATNASANMEPTWVTTSLGKEDSGRPNDVVAQYRLTPMLHPGDGSRWRQPGLFW
jgi:hypothetical protein